MPVDVLRDLEFTVTVGFRPLSLDLYRPDAPGAPLVVFLHGGGWMRGSRRVMCPSMTADDDPFGRIVAAGLAVASVDYRLSGEAHYPAQLDDVSAALTWLREHAQELAVDGSRIVLWGESAGATIAALAALEPGAHDRGIRGLVDWYGPSDLGELARELGQLDDPSTREAKWLGGAVATLPETAAAASPVSHVHSDAPPALIAHGLADEAVPSGQSELFAAALAAAGVDVELELVPGAGHMWAGEVDRVGLLERAIAFTHRVTG